MAVGGGFLGAGGLILALAACSSGEPASSRTPQPAYPVGVTPVPSPRTPVPTPAPRDNRDLCRASEVAWLVGKPKTEISVPVDVSDRRVVCTTCPVTEDYNPYRLNIFFDEETGVVERVSCG